MPFIKVASAEHKKREAELKAKLEEAKAKAEATEKAGLATAFEKWMNEERQALAKGKPKQAWIPLVDEKVTSRGGATFKRQPDGSWLPSGKNPTHDVYEIESPLAAGTFAGILLDCLARRTDSTKKPWPVQKWKLRAHPCGSGNSPKQREAHAGQVDPTRSGLFPEKVGHQHGQQREPQKWLGRGWPDPPQADQGDVPAGFIGQGAKGKSPRGPVLS